MNVGRKLGNGSYTGLVGKVFRGEVDMTGLGFSFTPERFEDMEISKYLYMDEVTAAYEVPTTSSNIAGFSNPFVVPVWLLMFAAFLFVSVICFLVDFAYPNIASRKRNFEYEGEGRHDSQRYQEQEKNVGYFGDDLARAVSWVLGTLLSQALPREFETKERLAASMSLRTTPETMASNPKVHEMFMVVAKTHLATVTKDLYGFVKARRACREFVFTSATVQGHQGGRPGQVQL
ncbi:uncharacterized protein [Palaemon carinicauda]|uniref:uncharacterized protein n=1 Tax=Palaemon carinicauda TaxID=392227 RepID=UPI0035B5B139